MKMKIPKITELKSVDDADGAEITENGKVFF